MASIVVSTFGGERPRLHATALPENGSAEACNTKLWNGIIRALREPLLSSALTKSGTIQSVYRTGDYWLHWAAVVDVVKSPLAGDTRGRLYYSGEYEPRVTTLEMASLKTDTVNGSDVYPSGYGESVSTDYPRAFYALGVPAPVTPPVLGTPSGGSGTDETRVYVYTVVSPWGEESAPSGASTSQTGKPDGSWGLSLMDTAPLNTGSIVGASYSGGDDLITFWTSGNNWLAAGHRITVASVGGMTELNASWTVYDCVDKATTTTTRVRTATHATLTVRDARSYAVGDMIVVSGVGGSGYNGTRTITSLSTSANTITFADATGVEGSTADTGGKVSLGRVRVSYASTPTSYTSGGTWTRQAPWNVGSGAKKRIYRSLTAGNDTNYYYVDEIDISTTTYTDTKKAAQLGETLNTIGFAIPPGELHSIVSLPGGFFAAAVGNEIYLSEPYKPYAWPRAYALAVDHEIVGLGAWGSTLVVPTTAYGYRAIGVHPESMALGRSEATYPCMSKRSIVSSQFGVIWASDVGLVIDGPDGGRILTASFYDRDSWQDNVIPASMISFMYDDHYYGLWPVGDGSGDGLIFAPRESDGLACAQVLIDGAWSNPETGIAYVVDSDGVKMWDAGVAMSYQWDSKSYVLPRPMNFSAARVRGELTQAAEVAAAATAENALRVASNAAIIAATPVGADEVGTLYGEWGEAAIGEYDIGGDILEGLLSTSAGRLQFQLISNGAVVFTKSLSDTSAFRLPGGFKTDILKFRITGDVDVYRVALAETLRELKSI